MQLGATLLLAVIRAFLRSHVGDDPKPAPLVLPPGVESSTLVTNLESGGCCILSERSLPGPLCREETDIYRSRLARSQLIDDEKNITRDYGQRTTDVRLRILRMLALQYELLRWLPEKKEVVDLTSVLCKAMEDTRHFILGDCSSELRWTQYMILSKAHTVFAAMNYEGADEKEIIGIELSMGNSRLDAEDMGSTRRLIQSMICLSWHYYCTNELDMVAPQEWPEHALRTETFWILSSGTHEEIKERRAQIQNLLPDCTSWIRDNNNILNLNGSEKRQDFLFLGRRFQCFGLGQSSLFTSRPEFSNYELVFRRSSTSLSEPGTLLQSFATDIFSNFLRALVMENQTESEKKFGKENCDKSLKTIGKYLIDCEVCASDVDAKLAIIPALLALATKQEDVPEQPDEGEIAKKND